MFYPYISNSFLIPIVAPFLFLIGIGPHRLFAPNLFTCPNNILLSCRLASSSRYSAILSMTSFRTSLGHILMHFPLFFTFLLFSYVKISYPIEINFFKNFPNFLENFLLYVCYVNVTFSIHLISFCICQFC